MSLKIIRPIKIGNVSLANNLVLAPMAGITDMPFRIMCKEGGAGLVVGEMVSANALKFGSEKSKRMLNLNSKEKPISVQIFGDTPSAIEIAAKMAEDAGADIVDINFGCPVKKVVKSGAGSVLMKQEGNFADIITAAVKSVSVPVSVKMRSGFKKGDIISPKLAKIAEECGASTVTLHARPVQQMHTGPIDFEALEKTCQAVRIPVIGNGGVKSFEDVKEMIELGCAGVMIGQAAIGNPDIFDSIINGKKTDVSVKTKLASFLRLLNMNIELYGEDVGIKRIRKIAGYWIKNFPQSSTLRREYMKLSKFADIQRLFKRFISSH
jgi:tRNA-dihydrouridine synthase B